ncbi:MAG: protein kinase [Gemmatimonadales bacterium]|nr:protein kinase [Gemmatimonadales bacterium]
MTQAASSGFSGLLQALAGRYALQREVGSGGMAVVYLARDLKHDRPVAIKVLRPEVAVAVGPERFLREIEIAAKLTHPHILPLYDSGEAAGFIFYVMPFVEGESLRERVEQESHLPLEDALRIACEVAEALDYAHSQGVVHRDIKPENILLERGHAVVADFGVARAVTASVGGRLTESGRAVGTPAYMSPEQASAEEEIDGRSDLYALGCVVYEMLGGQPPFTAPTARAVLARHMIDVVPSLTALRPELPRHVTRAVTKALAKEKVDRFAGLNDFAAALRGEGAAMEESRAKSIAVLPFANQSADPENEYLSDGISEEIINALSKVRGLRVAARTSSFAFKETQEDIRAVGRQLNVLSVLEGSVRVAGNRLRATAQLINVADGYHLWSERYDRDMEDVFAIQDEIAQNIVRALRGVLTKDEEQAIASARTANVDAYVHYLRGRQFFRRFQHKALEYARDMFVKAIDIDPEYARAFAGMADCYSFLYMYFDSSESNLRQAVVASRRALELDPDSAEAHAARGLAVSLSKKYDEAEREFQTAIQLDPQLFEAKYFFARTRFHEGKFAESAALFEQACEVREDYEARLLAAQSYAAMGDDAEARAAYERALRVIEEHLELNPGDARAVTLGAGVLMRLDRGAEGVEWAERALTIDPNDAVVQYAIACAYSVHGLRDEALDLLEKAVRGGFGDKEWIANDPDLDAIRDDPRFLALMQEERSGARDHGA